MSPILILLMLTCSQVCVTEAKPFFAVKVVPIPVPVPEVNIFGVIGQVLGAKAALVGNTLKVKSNILHTVANLKGGLGALLRSSAISPPVTGIVEPISCVHTSLVPPPYQPVSVPATSYGTPLYSS